MIVIAKTHTRAQSSSYFTHVFGLFGLDKESNIMKALANEGINTIFDIYDELETNVDDYQHPNERGIPLYLSRGERRLLKSIYRWIFWLNRNYPNLDYSKLELEDYDQYRAKINHDQVNPDPTPSNTIITSPQTTSLVTNIKLDIKQYPIFNGDTASWPKFKRGVLSIASTHGLDKVFDENYTVPTFGDVDYQEYQEKNKFVYSIWTSRITSGLALTVI